MSADNIKEDSEQYGDNKASLPNAMTGAEVGVILKGTEQLIKGGQRLYEWIKREGSLFIQVLDSIAKETSYEVTIKLTNLIEHGIYLKSLGISYPENIKDEYIFSQSLPAMGFGSRKEKNMNFRLPELLPPNAYLEYTFSFKIPTNEELKPNIFGKQKPLHLGKGVVKFWQLNEGEVKEKEFEFSIFI